MRLSSCRFRTSGVLGDGAICAVNCGMLTGSLRLTFCTVA